MIDDGSTDAHGRGGAGDGRDVLSFGENRGLRVGIAAGYREASGAATRSAGALTPTASIPWPSCARLIALVREDACDVAVGSRFAAGEGYDADRYRAVAGPPVRHRAPAGRCTCGWAAGSWTPTSGMAAVNAEAMPVMAVPYTSGAPEVEALLRLTGPGCASRRWRCEMRARGRAGSRKLHGWRGVEAGDDGDGTLVFFGWCGTGTR